MKAPGGGAKRRKSNRVRTGHELFRPTETSNSGRHLVARDLRGLRGVLNRKRAELKRIAKRLELGNFAAKLLILLVALPRPAGRPLGVGLQCTPEVLADFLGCSVRTVHNARGKLIARGLLHRVTDLRRVSAITRARRPEHRLKHFYGWVRGELRRYLWAHVQGVDYPTARALTLLDQHAPETHRQAPDSIWVSLRQEMGIRLARFSDPASAPDSRCTPYKELGSVHSRFALESSRFALERGTGPPLELSSSPRAGSEGERTRAGVASPARSSPPIRRDDRHARREALP